MNSEPEKSFHFWTDEEREDLRSAFPLAYHKSKMILSALLCLASGLWIFSSFVWIPQRQLEKSLEELATYENHLASAKMEQTWQLVQECQSIHHAKQKAEFAKLIEKKWQNCEQTLQAFYSNPSYDDLLKKATSSHEKNQDNPAYTEAFFSKNSATYWQKNSPEESEKSIEEQWKLIVKALKNADPLQDSEMDPDLELTHWTFEKESWTLYGSVQSMAQDPLARLTRFQEELDKLELFSQVKLDKYSKEDSSFSITLES